MTALRCWNIQTLLSNHVGKTEGTGKGKRGGGISRTKRRHSKRCLSFQRITVCPAISGYGGIWFVYCWQARARLSESGTMSNPQLWVSLWNLNSKLSLTAPGNVMVAPRINTGSLPSCQRPVRINVHNHEVRHRSRCPGPSLPMRCHACKSSIHIFPHTFFVLSSSQNKNTVSIV